MEHEERLEERIQKIRADADRAEQQGDEMEQHGADLGRQVDNVRDEFRRKQQSEDVPGAQERDPASEGEGPPPEADIAPGNREDAAGGQEEDD